MPRYANISYASDEQLSADAVGLGIWTPQRAGVVAWTFDPTFANTSAIPTVGVVVVVPLIPPVSATVTNIACAMPTAATTPTAGQCFMGIYDQAGNLLRRTNDISAALGGAAGLITAALQSTVDLQAGNLYYGAFLQNAATGATLRQGYNSAIASFGPKGRYFKTAASGLTALPDPLGTINSSTFPIFLGLT